MTSPTFVLVNEYYPNEEFLIYHIDLYRIMDSLELESFGWSDYLNDKDGVSIIEWADRALDCLPEDYLKIELEHIDKKDRLITLTAKSSKYRKFLEFNQ